MQEILYRLRVMSEDSIIGVSVGAGPKERRVLDPVDRRILELLRSDARMPNNAVAAAVGIAPSTCHGRIRALQEQGVIRGFHADVDPAATGRGLQAMIAIRLHAHARSNLATFKDYLAQLPGVESIFFVTGDRDFLIHLALADSGALRDLVANNISVHPEVTGTNTSVIFEYVSVKQSVR